MIGMDGRPPLSTLLSHALVAFIIEFDNEFEHQTPHRTTDYGSTPGAFHPPFLLSMVMWTKFLQFIPEEGISVRDFQARAQISPKQLEIWLTRMQSWWRYVFVLPPASAVLSKRFHPDAVIRPTPGGRKAIAVWRPLTGTIEQRWRRRFGANIFQQLYDALEAAAIRLDAALPDSLPILGYGLVSTLDLAAIPQSTPIAASEPTLPGLLSKVLFAFAIEFERESQVSLAIAANVLRVASDTGVRVSDIPRLSGVSKEAVAMAVSFLEKRGFAIIAAESPKSRLKILRLNAKGLDARSTYERLVWTIEEGWESRYGAETIAKLRRALEAVVWDLDTDPSPLLAGLQPYADCWRAQIPAPEVLPHFPMILHRGGFPDGS